MTKEDLLAELNALEESSDPESAHEKADLLLLDYIGDQDIRNAFLALTRWYA